MSYRYAQVTRDDCDVFRFLAEHPDALYLDNLPCLAWVARDERRIVVLLLCRTRPYLTFDLVLGDCPVRPFMAIYGLWQTMEDWLRAREVRAYLITVSDRLAHYQRLLERVGFVPYEEITDEAGYRCGQVYLRRVDAPTRGPRRRAAASAARVGLPARNLH